MLMTHNYEGKSITKLQMDIELKQIRVLIWKILSFLNIISVPSCYKEDNCSKSRESCKAVWEESVQLVELWGIRWTVLKWAWSWRTSIAKIHYQGRTGKDTVDWKDLECAVVIRKVWRSVMAL
jgi:hypothetical protein